MEFVFSKLPDKSFVICETINCLKVHTYTRKTFIKRKTIV